MVTQTPSGQFSGEDIEFEDFMFNPGESGVVMTTPEPSADMQVALDLPGDAAPFMPAAGTQVRKAAAPPVVEAPQQGPVHAPSPFATFNVPSFDDPVPVKPTVAPQVPTRPISGPLNMPVQAQDVRGDDSDEEHARMQPYMGDTRDAHAVAKKFSRHTDSALDKRLATGPLGQPGTSRQPSTPLTPNDIPAGRSQSTPLSPSQVGQQQVASDTDVRLASPTGLPVQPSKPLSQHDLDTQQPTGPLSALDVRTQGSTPLRSNDVSATAAEPHTSSPHTSNYAAVGEELPATAWSDSSLVAIEDFSTVLLAMQSGSSFKTRQAAALRPLVSSDQTPAPSTSPVSESTMPNWASKSLVDMAPVEAPEAQIKTAAEESSAESPTFDAIQYGTSQGSRVEEMPMGLADVNYDESGHAPDEGHLAGERVIEHPTTAMTDVVEVGTAAMSAESSVEYPARPGSVELEGIRGISAPEMETSRMEPSPNESIFTGEALPLPAFSHTGMGETGSDVSKLPTVSEQPTTTVPASTPLGAFDLDLGLDLDLEPFAMEAIAPPVMPELPNIGQFMPAVTGMEEAFDRAQSQPLQSATHVEAEIETPTVRME
ncbi:MAG: hypothetical protein M3014_13390, partial [Chloroflexota bacterium]|nr:hypothetical protein [Chloroflexota bacterium]